jgi:hypothetical protein
MRAVAALVVSIVLVGLPLAAQTEQERRGEISGLIEVRLRSSLPVELTADTITVIGDVLRLKGQVKFAFDDTWISAEEATLNRAANKVTLIGNVAAHLGRELTPKNLPRIDFR